MESLEEMRLLIINKLLRNSDSLKSHIKETIPNSEYLEVSRLFNEAVNQLVCDDVIIYTPYKCFKLNYENKEVKRIMSNSKVVYQYNNRHVVGVVFDGSPNLYSFFVAKDLELLPGDVVVCDTSRGYSVGTVYYGEISNRQLSKATKWVVGKIDVSAHEERLRKEKEIRDIQQAMEERLKSIEETMKFQRLAMFDPSLAEMYKKLNEIDPGSYPALEDKSES